MRMTPVVGAELPAGQGYDDGAVAGAASAHDRNYSGHDFEALGIRLREAKHTVEAYLETVEFFDQAPAVTAAIKYSLFAPSKRIRPVLALLVADMLRADLNSLLPAACAVEMVHTASLILDDLPSMDDSLQRRGRPTCHRAHGEANAILAAFALLNGAYGLLADGWDGGPTAAVRLAIAADLSRAVGLQG